jgi:hypothetical protein
MTYFISATLEYIPTTGHCPVADSGRGLLGFEAVYSVVVGCPPKRCYPTITPNCVSTQKTSIRIFTAVKTSNLVCYRRRSQTVVHKTTESTRNISLFLQGEIRIGGSFEIIMLRKIQERHDMGYDALFFVPGK